MNKLPFYETVLYGKVSDPPLPKQKPDNSRINFEDRWFQVFDYLFINHNIFVPVNNRKFEQFINDFENNQPKIFNKLCRHLEEFSAEKIYSLFFENERRF